MLARTMMERHWILGLCTLCLLGSTLGLVGCAGLDTHVRRRAAVDFGCAPKQLRIVDSYATLVRVAGCGEIATYRCSDQPIFAVRCERIVWDSPQERAVTHVTTSAGSYTVTPKRRER